MNRLRLVAVLIAVVICGPRVTSLRAAPTTQPQHIVVLLSLDGLAGFYLDDPQAEMPNLRKLAADGARAAAMRAVVPTVTWPNHTSIVTGDQPALHGVDGNNYYDRDTGKTVGLIYDAFFDKEQIVKVPTIYDIAHEHGLRTIGVRWPASRRAKTLDWSMPDCKYDDMVKYTTPAFLDACRKQNLFEESDADAKIGDPGALQAFFIALQQQHPDLALLHLANVDHTEHLNGPRSPEAYAAIKQADGYVGQIVDTLNRDYPGRATLFVVSDHGFSIIDHALLPNVILRNAGLITVKGPRVVEGKVRIVTQGGATLFYITDTAHRDEVAQQIKNAFDGVDGVDKILLPTETAAYGVGDPAKDPHAPDMVLFAKMGWTCGDTAAGALTFQEKPERKGTHGHNPDQPDLHATFIAWGAGIRHGVNVGDINNLDVAPTMAKLMGFDMPNVQGKVLTAALEQAP